LAERFYFISRESDKRADDFMKNKFEIRNDHVAIFANRSGKTIEILIDFDDLEKAREFTGTWTIFGSNNSLYARATKKRNDKTIQLLLHRLLTNCETGKIVDHINHNTLDNRKKNLRVCTSSQNQSNRTSLIAKTSNYKGVYFDKERRKWTAQITVNRKGIYLGRYLNEKKAAQRYNEAAIKYFGEFALINNL
jgi:hypothetical protein